jgi:hypothetical protein
MAQEAGQEKQGRGANDLSPNGRAALWYAKRGIHVFPCHWIDDGKCSCRKPDCSAGKHPCTRNGLTDATTDPAKIARWWRKDPSANIAASCGPSGLAVIDIDPRHGGDATWAALAAGFADQLPDTVRTITPSGGLHIAFQGAVPSGNGRLGAGVDVKSVGGYVMLPPSNHLQGTYRFEVGYGPNEIAFAPMPEALVALARGGAPSANGDRPVLDTAQILAGVSEGQRDETLFRFACKLRRAGVPIDMAEKLIREAAEKSKFPVGRAVEKVHRAYKKYEEADTSQGASQARNYGFKPVTGYLAEVAAMERKKQYWQGILREGEVALMLGRAMSGKSTAACALARSIHLGVAFLGRECAKGRVGYMALERNGLAVARLLDAWGLADLPFLTDVPPSKVAEFLDAQIAEHKLDVVFVDHLQQLTKIGDGNDYSGVSNALMPYAHIAKRRNCLLVLLHHQGKTETVDGTINAIGSEAYRAAADALIECTKKDGDHFIAADVRGSEGLDKFKVEIDLGTGDAVWAPARAAELDKNKSRITGATARQARSDRRVHHPRGAQSPAQRHRGGAQGAG